MTGAPTSSTCAQRRHAVAAVRRGEPAQGQAVAVAVCLARQSTTAPLHAGIAINASGTALRTGGPGWLTLGVIALTALGVALISRDGRWGRRWLQATSDRRRTRPRPPERARQPGAGQARDARARGCVGVLAPLIRLALVRCPLRPAAAWQHHRVDQPRRYRFRRGAVGFTRGQLVVVVIALVVAGIGVLALALGRWGIAGALMGAGGAALGLTTLLAHTGSQPPGA